jgi:hypothetical protein
MCEDRSSSKGFLESLESSSTLVIEIPDGLLLSKSRQRNNNVGVIENITPVKISKAKEGLNILDFSGFGPIENDSDFFGIHF